MVSKNSDYSGIRYLSSYKKRILSNPKSYYTPCFYRISKCFLDSSMRLTTFAIRQTQEPKTAKRGHWEAGLQHVDSKVVRCWQSIPPRRRAGRDQAERISGTSAHIRANRAFWARFSRKTFRIRAKTYCFARIFLLEFRKPALTVSRLAFTA